MKFEMSERDRRTRSSSASSKLEGLLQELIDNPNDRLVNFDQENEKGSPTETEEAPASDIPSPEPTSSNSSPRKSNTGKSPRKRRRREAFGDSGSKSGSASHVMKFLDREVDLAQFDDSTSMYVLCRAWMENNPSQTAVQAEQLSSNSSPTRPTQLSQTPFSASPSVNCTVEPLLVAAAAAEAQENSKEIWHLPPPVQEKNSDHDLLAPKGLPRDPLSLDLYADPHRVPATEDLKKQHIEQWKKVRSCWRDYLTMKQGRYSESLALLRRVWHQHQEDIIQSSGQ